MYWSGCVSLNQLFKQANCRRICKTISRNTCQQAYDIMKKTSSALARDVVVMSCYNRKWHWWLPNCKKDIYIAIFKRTESILSQQTLVFKICHWYLCGLKNALTMLEKRTQKSLKRAYLRAWVSKFPSLPFALRWCIFQLGGINLIVQTSSFQICYWYDCGLKDAFAVYENLAQKWLKRAYLRAWVSNFLSSLLSLGFVCSVLRDYWICFAMAWRDSGGFLFWLAGCFFYSILNLFNHFSI